MLSNVMVWLGLSAWMSFKTSDVVFCGLLCSPTLGLSEPSPTQEASHTSQQTYTRLTILSFPTWSLGCASNYWGVFVGLK